LDFVRVIFPVLAALIVVAVLLSARDPLRIPLYSFFKKQDSADLKARLNQTRLNQLDSSIMMYFYVHGSLPSKLSELVENHYLRDEDIQDPWSRPYLYDVSGDTYILSMASSGSGANNRAQIRRTVGRLEQPARPVAPKKDSNERIRFENSD
ncbi:MAG: hypothetical protein ACRD4B_07030, partial [Acidobacteriota bacterium]